MVHEEGLSGENVGVGAGADLRGAPEDGVGAAAVVVALVVVVVGEEVVVEIVSPGCRLGLWDDVADDGCAVEL